MVRAKSKVKVEDGLLNEFYGNVETSNDFLTPEELEVLEWENIIMNLKNVGDKAWVCLVNDGKVSTKELRDCDSEFFYEWVNQVYPPARNMVHKAADYETFEARENMWWHVFKLVRALEFPKGSFNKQVVAQQNGKQ